MYRFLVACLLGAGLPMSAWAFPVDVELNTEGVAISSSSSYLGNIATVTLINEGSSAALCRATFVNGPERPPPTRISLPAGEKTVVTQALIRHVTRVRVTVNCEAED